MQGVIGKMTERQCRLLAIMLLALMAYQATGSLLQKSLTYDEVAHLPAGYSYLAKSDYLLNLEQPPLIKLLAGAPLLFTEVNFPEAARAWKKRAQYPFGKHFLYYSGNDAQRLALLGRLPMVALTIALGWFVFRWSRQLFGALGGFISLSLYIFSPNILAHGRLVTMDLGLACFGFIACYYGFRYLRSGAFLQLVFSCFAFALALATKFSALLFLPVLLLMFAVRAYREQEKRWAPALGQIAMSFAVLIAASALTVWAAYGFRGDAFSLYALGIKLIYWNQLPGYHFYLAGGFSAESWWYYYLYAFIIKTPLPVLILFVAAVIGLFCKKREHEILFWLSLPIIIVMFVSAFDTRNLGLRRVLAVYPFVFVICGAAASFLVASSKRNVLAVFLALLLGWHVLGTIRQYPDYLSYFNELVGGPENGTSYLDDSNIDWGQDLIQLSRYLEENDIEQLRLFYFGQAEPRFHGIDAANFAPIDLIGQPEPESGFLAISAHYRVRLKLLEQTTSDGFHWLSRATPIANIGNSIFVYGFQEKPD